MGDPQKEEFLALFQCHKVVRAGKVLEFGRRDSGDGFWVSVEGARGGRIGFPVSMQMISRFEPKPGDYYVVYDDGYASFSPKKAFEEGYSLKR